MRITIHCALRHSKIFLIIPAPAPLSSRISCTAPLVRLHSRMWSRVFGAFLNTLKLMSFHHICQCVGHIPEGYDTAFPLFNGCIICTGVVFVSLAIRQQYLSHRSQTQSPPQVHFLNSSQLHVLLKYKYITTNTIQPQLSTTF